MSIGKVVPVCVLVLLLTDRVAAEGQQPRSSEAGAAVVSALLLDVPYVPQSEALCGGAAVAMVFRYWGMPQVYAEDFASLVDNDTGGIRLGDLARAVQDRGWRALPLAATTSDVQRHLAAGRPVITLIEDAPGRNHYVVLVAWTGTRVVFHDPARGPFRIVDQQAFERAWNVTGRTTLLMMPPSDAGARPASNREREDMAPRSCLEPLEEAVRLARSDRKDDVEAAESLLSLVGEACPSFSGAPRELAGIRFLQKRWAEAARLAEQAVGRDPSDLHAWQLLASSRFLQGDADGALRAWNHRDEPRVDLARVEGLERVRPQVVAGLLNLPPQMLLTTHDLERAKRRVAMLPAIQTSRVSYSPRASGVAMVDVAVLERSTLPRTWPSLTVAGVQAATAREAKIESASPTGNGELWTTAWRWWPGRPRLSLSLATPQVWRWTGLWRVEGAWERQTYRLVPTSTTGGPDFARLRRASSRRADDALVESDRRRAAVTFGDWRSGSVRWEVTGALDHWTERGRHVSMGTAVEQRLLGDTLALRADSAIWRHAAWAPGFGSGAVSLAWRSATENTATWAARGGLYLVTPEAPLDVWPAADTGHVRAPLLRAHSLLEDGAIRGPALGRALAHGTLEFQRQLTSRTPAHLRWVAFVDLARAGKVPTAVTAAMQVDLGAGLRAELPGTPGALRLDIARGMRDGRVALSVAWQPAWPGW